MFSRLTWACVCAAGLAAPAHAEEAAAPLPSLRELEAAGATIGEIRIENDNIFDAQDEKENNALFRLANLFHIRTRQGVIERQLLFKRGDPLSVRVIEETERLLRANRYLYDVSIRATAWHDGVADLEVKTRDTWTLAPGVAFGRSGGTNSRRIQLQEFNALGTGTFVALNRSSSVDRNGTEFQISQAHALDGWTAIGYAAGHMSDGAYRAFSIQRPFYALDTRWAAGFKTSQDDRLDPVYQGGVLASQYRHRQESGEVFGGWSAGLVEGWTQRYSIGASYDRNTYAAEPGLVAPAQLPRAEELAGPFLRYELVEDEYYKVKNRDLIERVEYVAMGFQSKLQLGRMLPGLGSTRALWTYEASVSNGLRVLEEHTLLVAASVKGRHDGGHSEHELWNGVMRFYRLQSDHSLFYISVACDMVRDLALEDVLLLGGDNGLRGYPLRYQSGQRRALVTIEQRLYSDWFPFRLFRVGGAVFYDRGHAWGGPNAFPADSGWLGDVGFGLRILSARSAFGNTVHLDFAFPLQRQPGIPKSQFLLTTKIGF